MHGELYEQMMAATVHQGFLGALIGGAVSLIGGLSARSKAKRDAKAAEKASKIPMVTETEQSVDLDGMNAAAIKSGYNPMTLLMAGGLSAFTKTKNTTTGHNAMAGAQAQAAVPSAGSVIAGALAPAAAQIGDSMFKNMSPMGADYFPSAPGRGGGLTTLSAILERPGYGATNAAFTARPTMSSASTSLGIPTPQSWEKGDVTVTAPSYWLKEDPTLADVEMWETRDGDSEVGAALNWGSQVLNRLWYNTTGITHAERRAYFLRGVETVKGDINNAFDAVKGAFMSSEPQVQFVRPPPKK